MDGTKREELLRSLGAEVERLRTSEGWTAWLQTAAAFRQYSFRNQLLIASQRPDATRVAGYRAWQALGRQVRKGEKSIRILAPCVGKVGETEDGEDIRGLRGFRFVPVFDVSQTEGEPLAEFSMPEVRVSDGALFEHLLTVAQREGFEVATIDESPNGARGWFESATRRITLVGSFSLASRTRTLLHEMGHAFDPACAVPGGDRAERELIAESVAYLVGTSLGVDLAEASTFYVSTWGDAKELERLASRALDIAGRLEGAISQRVEVAA